ncbi:STAS domain-containing protein [Hymenobacter gummosus]|uniref:STAS domain-containing protein n=1 Tax=Hymenobacter gummosus TaxID=1776032 RepID=A0A431TXY4_9BACT|nr:STAS domain-containing protein [Hymenobacter gummosus]RTQ46852.1 STAS domain-containing protein [Hymenobacter gummosus]
MPTTPASAPGLMAPATPVDLDLVDAQQLARELRQQPASPHRPQLLIDCSQLQSLHTLGVSHVISQLLTLHRAGADIWLRNASPLLRRCLQLLKLNQLFHAT